MVTPRLEIREVGGQPDETNSTAADGILHAAIALQPLIRAARDEIEQGRRLPLHIVDKMKQAGIFGMAMPHEWGGSELDPISQLRVVEALAAADASVGWCAMINCMGAYSTASSIRRSPAPCTRTGNVRFGSSRETPGSLTRIRCRIFDHCTTSRYIRRQPP
jgi:alkylation response protein AidB-like acyl-CoA dehydrogenase